MMNFKIGEIVKINFPKSEYNGYIGRIYWITPHTYVGKSGFSTTPADIHDDIKNGNCKIVFECAIKLLKKPDGSYLPENKRKSVFFDEDFLINFVIHES